MNQNDTSRYEAAVRRNLAELQRALLNRRAMVAMEAVGGITNDVLKVIYYALFNDYTRKHSIDIGTFESLVEKLKHVRDKTHFHIDREAVLEPRAVWTEAGLN